MGGKESSRPITSLPSFFTLSQEPSPAKALTASRDSTRHDTSNSSFFIFFISSNKDLIKLTGLFQKRSDQSRHDCGPQEWPLIPTLKGSAAYHSLDMTYVHDHFPVEQRAVAGVFHLQ